MATNSSDQTIFNKIASEIINSFAWLIEEATKRRDQLLAELTDLRNEFKERAESSEAALKELEKMRANLLGMSIKQNVLKNVKEESLSPVEQQIRDLEARSVSEPSLRFDCPLTDMLQRLSSLGVIVDEDKIGLQSSENQIQRERVNYSERVKSSRIIGKEGCGNGEFKYPLNMHITDNDHLYVVDRDNKRVQVFDAESGNFLSLLGDSHLVEPNGVHANDLFCYVTDSSQNTLFQFSAEDYSLVSKVTSTGGTNKKLDIPAGLAACDLGLYVSDRMNDRVCVFDFLSLSFIMELGVKILKKPLDVKICHDEVYVLDSNSPHYLHTFDKSGGSPLRELLSSSSTEWKISDPASFCIDADRNIIVADVHAQTLKVFSQEGALLHRIGDEAPRSEPVGECYGVVLFRNSIFLSCSYPFHCIKVF